MDGTVATVTAGFSGRLARGLIPGEATNRNEIPTAKVFVG